MELMHLQSLPRLNLSKRSVYQWNLMIRAAASDTNYAQALTIYSSMIRAGARGNTHTYPLLFKSCSHLASVQEANQLHTHVVKLGFQADVFVQTSMIDAYSSCSCLGEARQLFDKMGERNEVTWSCMITAYSRLGRCDESFSMLKEMMGLGFQLRAAAVLGVLAGCDSVQGLLLHCSVIKVGLCRETELSNSLMGFYVHSGRGDGAWAIFNEMQEKSVVSWTIMMRGLVDAGDFKGLFSLFREARLETFDVDAAVFVSLISGFDQIGDHLLAASVHCLILKVGLENQSPIDRTLVRVYANCGDIVSSRVAFDVSASKDVSLWTSMIGGYVQFGLPGEAMHLFNKLRDSISPNEVTILTVLSACADLGSLSTAQEIEKYIIANGFESDVRVQTSLIHLYCKCGSLDKAESVFERVVDGDLAVWSAMINTYTTHGMGAEALQLFNKMQIEAGIKPDAVVHTSIFLACSHSGLVEEGLRYFSKMQKDFGIKPNLDHYCCLVDLLSRSGKFELALKTIEESPFRSQSRIWRPLLSACRIHKNNEVGELVAKKLLDLDPENTSNYLLVSSLYTAIGKYKEAAAIRKLVDRQGLVKEPGWSRIEFPPTFR
uniref:Pentatricopeptide repeat-containing protein n=1 Tax=Kalanchoe fedtschenkoi TaxID=63787 RepID=A0A7N0U3W3_KALFE